MITGDEIELNGMVKSTRPIYIDRDAVVPVGNYGATKGLNAEVVNYGTIKNENEYGGVMFDYDSKVTNYGTIDAGNGNVSLRGSYFYNAEGARVIAGEQFSIGSENLLIGLGVRGTFENYGYIEAKGSVGSNCGIVITADGKNYGTIFSSQNPYGGIQVKSDIENYGIIESAYEYGNALKKDHEGVFGTVTNLDGGTTTPAFKQSNY